MEGGFPIIMDSELLEEALTGPHGALDVERTDVLPILLEERNQKIDGQTDVGRQVVSAHGHVASGHGETEHLLKLELDGTLQLLHLADHIVRVSDHRWKLAGFVQSGSQNTGNLLDERVRRHERVVFLSEFLDQLFVLVHLFQRLLVHASDSVGGGFIAMLLIPQNANGELGPGDVTKLDGTGETLFLLGVVVLQINLKFDGLEELPVLCFGQLQHSVDALQNRVAGDFAHFYELIFTNFKFFKQIETTQL